MKKQKKKKRDINLINEEKWNKKFLQLTKFKNKKGTCAVPRHHDVSLYSWINNQRTNRKNGTLSERRYKKLKEINFWDDRPDAVNAASQNLIETKTTTPKQKEETQHPCGYAVGQFIIIKETAELKDVLMGFILARVHNENLVNGKLAVQIFERECTDNILRIWRCPKVSHIHYTSPNQILLSVDVCELVGDRVYMHLPQYESIGIVNGI